ncbi:MAG: hypothetical protein QOC98_2757, partial [Frankiaceae bacterium]|nr:hypothetical protein [Frankiaceae bacterium]
IDAVYRELAGTKPDPTLLPAEVLTGPIDESCRFRAAPHLL